MTILHAVIDFSAEDGKKYYPSDPAMAESCFIGAQVTEYENKNLAAHIIVDETASSFEIHLHEIDDVPDRSRRMSEADKRDFLSKTQCLKTQKVSLSFMSQAWRDYLHISSMPIAKETPKLTEDFNKKRKEIHDLISNQLADYLSQKGLANVEPRRFISLLRTYKINRAKILGLDSVAP